MLNSRTILLIGVSAYLFWLNDLAAEEKPGSEHEAVLLKAGIKTDDAALLDFFRKRTPSETQQADIPATVRKLGDDSFQVREKASAELAALGRLAVPFLQKALKDPDPEVGRRATKCLQIIENDADKGLVLAAAGLLQVQKPTAAAGVLLHYLPFADEAVEEELFDALCAVGVREGKADPVLRAALKDKDLLLRAGAARSVGQSSRPEERALVRPLLTDPEAKVRLCAAQGLVVGREKEAVPVLIDLLGEAPLPLALRAEDLLCRIAGEKSPDVSLGVAERRKCREAWNQWWSSHGPQVELAKIEGQRRPPRLPAILPVPVGKSPDVIYVPTPQGVVDKMLELAKVKKGDVVYDLGCGDGRIVVTAAKKYGAYGFGFDIDPWRVKDSLGNVKKNRVEKLVTIKQADVFTLDLREATVIYLYLLPTLNVKLIPQFEKCKPGTRILSHDFDMRGIKPDQVVTMKAKDDGGEREHTLYIWTTPLKKE